MADWVGQLNRALTATENGCGLTWGTHQEGQSQGQSWIKWGRCGES